MIVTPVKTDLQVVDTPLAYEVENRPAINAYWNERLATNPRLWNGPFFLFTEVVCANNVLNAKAHRTDFATFLYLRRIKRDPAIAHITGTSLMMTADNVLVAMEMAAHTENAGKIYFPAGSFDPVDTVDGRLDPMSNVRRELEEETGFVIEPESFGDAIAAYDDQCWHVALPNRLALTVAECEAQVKTHQDKTGDDELARLVPIRSKADAQQMMPFARMLAEHVLSDSI